MKTPHLFSGLLALALVSLPLSAALAQADYSIATDSGKGTIAIVNGPGLPDSLVVSDSGTGGITFMVPNRSFQVNNNAPTQNSATVSLAGVTTITINCGANGQYISIGAFSGMSFPSLIINGSSGNDTVVFTGNITFGTDKSLTVNLQTGGGNPGGVDSIYVSGAQLKMSGLGAIDLECSQRISISGGAKVTADEGNITLMANQQSPATSGNFSGVTLDGAGTLVQTTGSGPQSLVTVTGTGGDDSGGFQAGISVTGGAQLLCAAPLSLTGKGGASTGIENRGVMVYGAGSAISNSNAGALAVTGTGGAKGSDYNTGISVLNGGLISSTNEIELDGTGGGLGNFNYGVEIGGAVPNGTMASTVISTSPGPSDGSRSATINVSAIAGPGNSLGLILSDAAEINGFYDGMMLDSLSIFDTASIIGTSKDLGIGIIPFSATTLDLGGNSAAGTLGLGPALIAGLKASSFGFVNPNGNIVISQPITLAGASVVLGAITEVKATAMGTDFDLGGGTLNLAVGSLSMPITGTVADTGYPQLHVKGSVSLTPGDQTLTVTLDLTTTYAGKAGDTFTIVKVDGGQLIGTFSGYPEGFTFPWPANPALNAQITYLGGTGHDVVITLKSAGPITPTLSTQASATTTVGSPIHDTATLSGSQAATGTITFNLYGPNDPTDSKAAVFTTTATVNGDGSYVSANYSPALPGTYNWVASYSGDANNNPVTGAANNEAVAVSPITPTLSTQASATTTVGSPIHDTATLSGSVSATGMITFNLYGPNDPTDSSAAVFTTTATVNGDGSYISANYSPALSGTYNWVASYSGDANNNAVTGAANNEAVVVSPTTTQTPGVLGNISTRLSVGTGNNVLIGGFIITGSQSKQVLVRATGPSLSSQITGFLADPMLTLFDGSNNLIGSNDNWQSAANAAQIPSNLQPGNPAESAILITLNPGSYTAIVSGVGGTTGIALVEAYDLQQTPNSKLANISTRGFVQTGNNVMIGGVIIQGNAAAKVIVRGRGPTLTGVPNPLLDPQLSIVNSNGMVVASNDNWQTDPGAAEMMKDNLAPSDPHEAATLQTLAPGNYTAIVSGVGNTTGIGLVEVYNVQ